MSESRALLLLHPSSIAHVRPGDVVVTDSWILLQEALQEGIGTLDLRELLGGKEDLVDETVSNWRATVDSMASPRLADVPLLACMRAELLWGAFFPFVRYAVAATELLGAGYDLVTDIPYADPRYAGIAFATRSGEEHPLPSLPSPAAVGGVYIQPLPESHGLAGSTGRQRSLSARARSVLLRVSSSLVTHILERKGDVVAYGHYATLGHLHRELARRFRLVLWPWGLPRRDDLLRLAAKGVRFPPVLEPTRALAELLPRRPSSSLPTGRKSDARDAQGRRDNLEDPDLEERTRCLLAEAVSPWTFRLSGSDATPSLVGPISRVVARNLPEVCVRVLAARDAVARAGASAVVTPYDTSLDFAPLALYGRAAGIPVVVVAHGMEGSAVPGDKRLATHVLAWSESMQKALARTLARTSVEVASCGPLHLGRLRRVRPPARDSVLFLSYAVRHNTAWDSWMDAEKYLELLARTLPAFTGRLRTVGLKIHPSEDPAHYTSVLSRVGLGIRLISEGLVHDNLDDAGLVVGPFSTGLVEAYHLGSMPVCVNLSGGPLPPPCDGSTEIPVVADSDSLAAVLGDWLHGKKWAGWKPAHWPAFGSFVGEATDAERRAAVEIGRFVS